MDVALVTSSFDLPILGDVDRPLVDALDRRGVQVHRPVWHDPAVAWDHYDLALVRTTWDYHHRRDEFVAWAASAATATRLWNPADVLRWNTHKSYLLELEERGAPVVPTAWLGQGDTVALPALLEARGWPRAVVKPAVGASAEGLVRVDVAGGPDALDAGQRHLDELLADGDAMVQPYLDAVERRGELSVVVVAGEVTHAVRKRPAAGDFRIQEEYGGRADPEPVSAEVAALARWVVDATATPLLLARVDLLEDATGALQLAELEVTEPDLFLGVAPGAAERLASAIVDRVAGRAA